MSTPAGLLGAIGGKVAPKRFVIGGGHGAAKQTFGPALIDDDTPVPAHARFTWAGLARVVGTGLLLWGGTIGILGARYGWHGALSRRLYFNFRFLK